MKRSVRRRLMRWYAGILICCEKRLKCEGTLVKTIGDSVMAAFFDPAKAIEAAFAMHESINKDNAARVEPVLALKIGIHHGPCIAVNMNDIFAQMSNVDI